jgi:hypothetical protein
MHPPCQHEPPDFSSFFRPDPRARADFARQTLPPGTYCLGAPHVHME